MARKKVIIHNNPKEVHLDIEQIKSLAALGLTKEKMAKILKIDRHTLKNIESRDQEIDTAIQEGRILGEIERRKKRRELYNGGFWPALKHAMATEDGVIEKAVSEVSGKDGQPLFSPEIIKSIIDKATADADADG
jgi:DNA-binding XRE family transcriptional regulator